jgi:ABC-type glycerol-3-phosphate transport system permease component
MSEQLTICLAAVTANLVAMVVIHFLMAHFLARLAWHHRGIVAVIVTILVTQLLWIAPALLIGGARNSNRTATYALWFGNWLVSGFAIVLLRQSVRAIPRQLEDAARLDGLGLAGTWRHIILPFVRRDLALIALFTLMATLLPFWALTNLADPGSSIVFQQTSTVAEHLAMMAAASLIGTLPLMAIFFLAKPRSAAA